MTHSREQGFSFLELAIAMFILTLLLGSILVPLVTQVEQRQISETQKTMEAARDALLGHSIARGYLPCPDTDNDGIENVTSGNCSNIDVDGIAHGNLPWQTLGIATNDAWGNRLRYAVSEQYAERSGGGVPFTLDTTVPNIRVCRTETTCATSSLTTDAVAILVSHGKNGYGATNSESGTTYATPTSNDERENWDQNRDFVSRTSTSIDTTAGEFDDIVLWISRYTLFNRMIAAGRLP
jgi:type II secretory pathway pseudopilin PulG